MICAVNTAEDQSGPAGPVALAKGAEEMRQAFFTTGRGDCSRGDF